MILKFTSGTQECVPFFYSVGFYFANRAENLCYQFNHGRKLLPQFRKIVGAVSRTISLMRLLSFYNASVSCGLIYHPVAVLAVGQGEPNASVFEFVGR